MTRSARLRDVGAEPDPRFTLANERTFLAWVRTALALLASGVAAVELLGSEPLEVPLALGLPLMLLATAAAIHSYGRWEATERALRLQQPLPYSSIHRVLSWAVATVAIVALALAISRI